MACVHSCRYVRAVQEAHANRAARLFMAKRAVDVRPSSGTNRALYVYLTRPPFRPQNLTHTGHVADVRVRYQNQDKALPFCAEEGKHLPGSPEFCTLAAFRERVKELTPVNWEAECAHTSVNKQKDREEAQAAAALVIAKP